MSRIDTLRQVDPVLSNIAQGYSNNTLISEQLFPMVEVNKLKGKIPLFGKEAFFVRETTRAFRANSNRIPPLAYSMIDFETNEHDVEMAVDYLEEQDATEYNRYEIQVTKDLIDTLKLEREKTIADYVQNASNFASDMKNVVAIESAFDDYSNSVDPILVVKEAMEAVRAKIAKYPNTMIMGISTYRALENHPRILERVKYVGLGKTNVDILKELLEIQDIIIGQGVYTDNGMTFNDIWKDNILCAYVDKSDYTRRSEFNPSFGYTFRRKGMPEIDTYFEHGAKVKVIRATDNYTFKVTSPDAAFLISHTNHF